MSPTLVSAFAVALLACSAVDAFSLTSEVRSDGAIGTLEPRLVPSADALPAINPRTARYLTRRARMRAPNVERGDGFSDPTFFSTLGLNMTRAITAPDGDGVRDIALLMARLHAQQHPQTAAPYETRATACAKARLLVVQFVPESFEGLCSILKTLMLGLGQAAWSNRTLIWGADLTPLFDLSRPAWEASRGANRTVVHGVPLSCDTSRGGGAYNCFFEPLSSCSLADVTWEELRGLGESGLDDTARVKIAEARRGVTAYEPPPGVLPPSTVLPRHKWTAAIAAYTFRVKPELYAAFERSRKALAWPADSSEVACAQIRHGDILANPDVYFNRRTFPFTQYFEELRRLLPKPPAAVFVASDNPRLREEVAAETALRRWGRGAAAPRIFTSDDAVDRFRTAHGSHTVAAEGACSSKGRCILAYTDVVAYNEKRKAAIAAGDAPPPKHMKLMEVMFEAVEDLHLLSHCGAALAVIACSHYSTFAAMLSWARTGGATAAADRVAFLDMPYIAEGELQNSFLHQSLNYTAAAKPGVIRWRAMQKRFVSGAWPEERWAQLSSPAALMHSDANLPRLPPDILLAEAARWVSPDLRARVWPGECPLGPSDPVTQHPGFSPEALLVIELIAQGATQHELGHSQQALRCWSAAAALLRAPDAARRIHGERVADAQRAEWLDIAEGNVRAVRHETLGPYSYPPAAVAHMLSLNVRLDADAAPPTLVLPREVRDVLPPPEELVERRVP